MNKNSQIIVALVSLTLSLSAWADAPSFGNLPNNGTGFSLVAYNGLSMSGGAVEFTPTENIDLTNVTLWLSGYTGQYGQSVYASIWVNYNNSPATSYINLASAAANNGSLAAFTFSSPSVNPYTDPSGSTVLSADTSYWLVVTAGEKPGTVMTSANWVGGGSFGGAATYNASDSYNVYGSSFSPSCDVPAFGINDPNSLTLQEVPEPGSLTLMGLASLLGMACLVYKRWKARAESLKLARVKVASTSFRKRA